MSTQRVGLTCTGLDQTRLGERDLPHIDRDTFLEKTELTAADIPVALSAV